MDAGRSSTLLPFAIDDTLFVILSAVVEGRTAN
jgi:hypothetical protein